MSGAGAPTPVLVAAGGEQWETAALDRLGRSGRYAVHRRCVDVPDLLASAATGLARAALVAAELPGLDGDALATLRRHGLTVVVVGAGSQDRERWLRLGARAVLDADLAGLVEELAASASDEPRAAPEAGPDPGPPPVGGSARSRLTAVWGPAGAPGRTTVAVALAVEAGRRGRPAVLVDADPYGGTVAQHLGVLEEVSGLLAAARAANAGELDPARLARCLRTVADGCRVLTGLPRPDRWPEVRPQAYADLLDTAARLAEVVVADLGFSVERDPADPFGTAPQRNQLTLATLERADDLVVVGAADPVGLARLARGLVELRELAGRAALHVVVNRNRPTLGWSEREIRGMVEGFVGPAAVWFLPEDREAADRALVAGRSVVEAGDGPLRRSLLALADGLWPPPAGPGAARGRSRRRRPGARVGQPPKSR